MSEEKKQRPVTPVTRKRAQQARRQFLRSVGLAAGVVSASLLGFAPVARKWKPRLRPPGARKGHEFLAACIKCGRCVRVCPVEALLLDDITSGFGRGVAYIDARTQACDFSCDGLQCVLACPTGALTHEIAYPHEVDIGFARVDRPGKCLAMLGLGFTGKVRTPEFTGKFRYSEIDRWNPIPVRDRDFDLDICDLCVQHCPIEIRITQCDEGDPPSGDENQCPPHKAIELEEIEGYEDHVVTPMKPVVLEGCVGCGACEMVCPTEPPAIVIDMSAVLPA